MCDLETDASVQCVATLKTSTPKSTACLISLLTVAIPGIIWTPSLEFDKYLLAVDIISWSVKVDSPIRS